MAALGAYHQLAAQVMLKALDLGCQGAWVEVKGDGCRADGGVGSNGGEAMQPLPATFFL